MTAKVPHAFAAPEVLARWSEVLDSKKYPKLGDHYMRGTMAQLLENEAQFLKRERLMLANEATPTNVTGNIAKWDPVLIDMVRRVMPILLANELVGVQPMSLPSGLAFAKIARRVNASGPEAFVGLPDTGFTGTGVNDVDPGGGVTDGNANLDPFSADFRVGHFDATATKEGDVTAEMATTIESVAVHAKTRKIKTSYSMEQAQDLATVHRMDADAEFSKDLQEELIREINMELIRTIYYVANLGCSDTATPGTYDASPAGDGDGRYLVERFKTFMHRIDLEANQVFYNTAQGRANKIIAPLSVVTALRNTSMLDVAGAQADREGELQLNPDESLFAGRLNGQYDVYMDPYHTGDFVAMGYKGADPFKAGLFYCPYVPFTRVDARDPASGQPVLFYMTRSGLVANPFVTQANGTRDGETLTARRNSYYRIFKVTNL